LKRRNEKNQFVKLKSSELSELFWFLSIQRLISIGNSKMTFYKKDKKKKGSDPRLLPFLKVSALLITSSS